MFWKSIPHRGRYIAVWAVVYPVVVWWLMYGGFFGLERVETRQWGGLTLTLIIASVGIAGALPWGILLALGRRSHMPVVRILSVIFIEFWRGVPLITVLFMSSVMLPLFMSEGTSIDKLIRALVGVILFQSAYVAEVVRGGLQALPKGQYEAAESLALGYWKTQGLVILPQALKLVIRVWLTRLSPCLRIPVWSSSSACLISSVACSRQLWTLHGWGCRRKDMFSLH